MRRIAACLLSALSLALCGQSAFAQTTATINSASPTSVSAGSGDTVLTLTLRQSGTTRYNVCFYSGVTSTPITPTAYNFQNASAVTYTLTVPGARFQTGGGAYTNSVYLAPTSSTSCTAANQGISNIFSYSTTASSYTLSSASPSSSPISSPATSITFSGTLPTSPANGTGLGLCFYNGTSNAPLLPTSQSGTSSATFTVPSADFSTAGTARVYLASDTSTCTGVSPGYSNTLSYTVSQLISSSYPSPIPAGNSSTQVSLYGVFSGSNANICFYTGTSSSSTLITPSTFNYYEVVFTVPAASLSIPPSSFSSGIYNAKVYFAPAGATCNGTSTGISNTYNAPVVYPQIVSTSIDTIPQVNPAIGAYTPIPNKLDLLGNNFASGVYGSFTPSGGSAVTQGANAVNAINYQSYSYQAPVTIPTFTSSAATTSVNVCNNNGTYQYCASAPVTLTNYPLASTTSQITSSVTNPAPNQSTLLSAFVTPGTASTTAGGKYVPGVPTGGVTFYDGSQSLGTTTLFAESISFLPASSQQININGGSDSLPGMGSDAKNSTALAAAGPRPQETPSPDTNTDFSTLVADFNQDGIPDTLLIQSGSGVFHLFLGGSPLGTIQAEQTIYPGTYSCASLSGVTVADFNSDGYPDIAFLCGDSGGYTNLRVILNQKDGSFSDPVNTLANDTPNQVAAADVNKDGKIDLVVSGNYGPLCCTGQTFGIRTYLGNGDGTFTSGALTTTTDIPGTQVVLRDMNNDGIPDLTFLHYNTQTSATEVNVWQGDGTGKFTKVATLPVCNCQTTTSKLFVTPLANSSPYPDIVVFYAEGTSILVFTNKGSQASIGFNTMAPAVFSNLKDVILGQFGRDGNVDLATYDGTYISVAEGNGAGTFPYGTVISYDTSGIAPANALSLAAAPDLNGDGFADLLVINPNATSNPTTSTIQSLITSGTSAAYLQTSFAGSGNHSLSTVYNGDHNVLGSTASLTLTVGQTTPTITWNPPSTTTTTTPVSTFLNATAVDPSTGAAVPGTFAYTYTPANGSYLSAGTQTITAAFTPTNTSAYNSSSARRSITVNKVTPTISTTINPGNHTYTPNLATTYSAFVTGANIVPTGTVQFNSNGSTVGTPASLNPSGTNQASTQIVFGSLPAGTFALTGTYQGDSVYNAVTSAVTNYTVSQSAPTITYTPAPTSIAYGTGLVAAQLNATAVDPNTRASIPGTVTYSTPGFTSLQAGSILPAGANVITASFAPTDSQDYASGSKTATINVAAATTTTAVTVSPTTISSGQSTRLTVTVSPNPSGTAVTGLVTFSDDNGTIPNAQVTLSNGTASLNYTPANTGTHHISAAYAGTVNDSPSSSTTPATFTVTQATPRLTYTPTPATIAYGTGLVASQLNATAVDANGTTIPGVFTYATPTIPSVQAGTILPVGTNVVTAKFTPTDTNTYSTVGQGAAITVTPAPTLTSVTASPSTITLHQATTLTATVSPTPSSSPVTGTITFADDNGTIPSPQVTITNGVANLSYTPTTSGTHRISAAYAGATNYASSSTVTPASVTVGQIAPTLTFVPNPASIPYGTALVAGQRNATAVDPSTNATIPGVFAYSTSAIPNLQVGAILPVGANVITVAFTPTDTASYTSVSKTATVTVTRFTPNIVWATPTSIPYGTALSATQLNAVANDVNGTAAPGTYSYNPAAGTIPAVGNTSDTVTFTPTDTTNFTTATATRTITVTAASTTTTLTLNPASITLGQSSTLTATVLPTVGSGPVTGLVLFSDGTQGPGYYSLTNGVATAPYTPTTVGTHSITVSYNGTGNYNSSSTVAPSILTVTQGAPVITFTPNPSTIPYGTPLSAAQLNAIQTTSIPGAFSYSSPLGTVLPVGANTITATFTPTDTTSYSTVTRTATVTVTQFTPVITWAASTISFGTALSSAQLNAVANVINGTAVPGTYSYNPAAGTILPVGANQVAVTFTPADATSYTTANTTRTITVIRTATVTTLSINPASVNIGQPATITATVTPTSGTGPVTGQVSFTDSLGTISPAQVTLVNGVASFSYSPTAVGTHVITVSFPNTTSYSASSAGSNLIVSRGVPVIDFTPNPSTIPYGTPLTAAQLNATQTTTSIPGAFSYSSPVGTILNAGVNTITATFTPTDAASYSTVTRTANVTVTPATTTTILTANPSAIALHQATTLTATITATPPSSPVAGTVTFADDNGSIPSSQVTVTNGMATLTYTPATAGTHHITAAYAGTANYAASSAAVPATLIVGQTTPTITFTPTPASIPFGTSLLAGQLTATALDPTTSLNIPGTFAYSTATFPNLQPGAILPVGANVITAAFTPADAVNFASVTRTATITVTPATTATTLTINPASITLGQSATLTATVTPTPSSSTPVTGQVTFTDDRGTIPSSQVSLVNGVATLTYTAATSGTHHITAAYAGTTNYAASSTLTPGSLNIGQKTPTVTFTPTPTSIPYGTGLVATQLDATAIDPTSGSPIPGSFAYATPTQTNLQTGAILPAGANVVTATFTPADTTNYATLGQSATITVTPAPTATTITANPTSIALRQPTTLTATITATPTGTPVTGQVTFADDNGTIPAPQVTIINGVATLTYTPAAAGTHRITAIYTATANYTASSTALPAIVTVTQTTATLTYTPTPAGIPYGTGLTTSQLTATAIDSVTKLAIPGAFTYSIPAVANLQPGAILPTGVNTLTATFIPTDTVNFVTISKTAAITVTPAPTTIALTANPASISLGQSTTLTATVAPTPTSTPITGQVTFTDDNGTIPGSSVTVTNGVATLTYTPTVAGVHHLSAAYAATTNYAASSTATPATLAVGQVIPALTYTPTPNSISYGTGLVASQLTAIATDPTTSQSIPGTFTYATPAIASLQPGVILPTGLNTVTAAFTPTNTTNYAASTITATINVISSTSTIALAITSSGAPATSVTAGTIVTLTASVTASSTPLGQVNFCDASAPTCTGVHLLGSAQLTSAGTATLRFIPSIGTHTYAAVFTGTRQNTPSASSAATLSVTGLAPTVTTLASTGTPGAYTLTATTTGTGSQAANPTGLITFADSSNNNAPLGTAALSPGATSQTFPTQTTASGLTGSIVLTADFNGDGIPDVITGVTASSQSSSSTFSVFLGNGDATFTLKSALARQGQTVVAGDFNHDGILDLTVYNGSTNSISTLLGNGDGTFTLKSTSTIPTNSGAPLVADFNRDGLLDLAIGSDIGTTGNNITTYTTGTLTVLLGAGDGTFISPRTTSTTSAASGAVSADFNNDGIPDILAANGLLDSNATVLLGKGDGTFTAKSTLAELAGAAIFNTADLNNDGIIDLADVSFYDTSVSTYLGKGDGTFTLKSTIQNPKASADNSNAFQIAFADFNQDGTPDIAVTADDGVFIYTGAGDGTFTITAQAVPQTTDPFTGENYGLAIADFNNDGLPDLITTASTATATNTLVALDTLTSISTATATGIAPIGGGSHNVIATYPGDTTFRPSTSTPVSLSGQFLTPTIAWTPAPLTLGTPLGSAQLNAIATGLNGMALPGTFTYNPPAGTLLPAGTQPLTLTFTPADLVDYTVTTVTATVRVSGLPTALTLTSSRNPSALSQTTVFTATITPVGGSSTIAITGPVTFTEGTTVLGTAQATNGVATLPLATLTVGTHLITATYSGDTAGNYLTSTTSTAITQVVRIPAATVTLAAPNATTYGQSTTLTATITPNGGLTAIPTGSVTFTDGTTLLATSPVNTLGQAVFSTSTLLAGPHTFAATYNGDSTNGSATSNLLTQSVAKAAPTLTFPTPAPVAVGTPLSATQLSATAAGVTGATLPGTFTYTPAAGAIVTSGPQTLTALFTPTDTANYATATVTTTLNGSAVSLTGLSPSTAALGDPDRTITLTGAGFLANSVARSNGVSLSTTYVNPTTLTAVLPAATFRTVQTLQITVINPTQQQTTAALPFTVTAPAVAIKVNAPSTANPGDQPTIQSALATAYPVDVTGTLTLAFSPISGGTVDPSTQFSTGGTTSTFTIPAGQTSSPNLQIQTGTVAGSITVRLALTAGGTDVTPTGLAPLTINVPSVAPTVTSVTLVRSGRLLTVNTLGFSNTREVTKAAFHFTPAAGQQIQTPDATIDVGALFSGWYSQTASTAYGSTFLYTQTFTLDDDASIVGQVTVTLSNGVGVSASGSSQQ